MAGPQVIELLKLDEMGRVERVRGERGDVARRVACGGALPGSRWLARKLARREQAALTKLDGLEGVARALDFPDYRAAASPEHGAPNPKDASLRSWIEGVPLYATQRLASNFFDLLEDLVEAMHARGVCHNDLHKEQNILVTEEGYPALLDFQLASIHADRGRRFQERAKEDLRHVQKHRRRYTRDGRGAPGMESGMESGKGAGLKRGLIAGAWRSFGKPVYNAVVHGLVRKRGSEPRRASDDPFPSWGPPLATRSASPGTEDRAEH